MKKYLSKNYKFAANSLVESIIALAIMASIIMISINILAMIFKQERGLKYYQTVENIKQIHYQTVTLKLFHSENIKKEGVLIKKKVSKDDENQNLQKIEYSFTLENNSYNFLYKINKNNEK